MIAQFTAETDGYVTGSTDTTFQIGRFDVQLHFGEDLLEAITLETALTEPEINELTASIEMNKSEVKADHQMTISLPEGLHDDVVAKFQTIEAFGGLHQLRGVYWEDIEVKIDPESPQERERIDVFGYHIQRHPSIEVGSWEFNLDRFDWELIEELRVPLSFYRRGMQLVDEQDYANAYTQFYMVLEGFYTDNSELEEDQMAESEEMMAAAEYGFNSVMGSDGLAEQITPFVDRYGHRSPEGYLKTLVIVRHKLSHFFYQEKEPHDPDPLKADQFEPLCRCIRQLAWYILQAKINEIEISRDQ